MITFANTGSPQRVKTLKPIGDQARQCHYLGLRHCNYHYSRQQIGEYNQGWLRSLFIPQIPPVGSLRWARFYFSGHQETLSRVAP